MSDPRKVYIPYQMGTVMPGWYSIDDPLVNVAREIATSILFDTTKVLHQRIINCPTCGRTYVVAIEYEIQCECGALLRKRMRKDGE